MRSFGLMAVVASAAMGCAAGATKVGDDLSKEMAKGSSLRVTARAYCELSDEERAEARKQVADHPKLNELVMDPKQCLRSQERQDQLWQAGVPLFWGILDPSEYGYFEVEYPRGEDRMAVVAGNGATDLDCYVLTSAYEVLAADEEAGDDCTMYFKSPVGGVHYLAIRNRGNDENRFLGFTDGDWTEPPE